MAPFSVVLIYLTCLLHLATATPIYETAAQLAWKLKWSLTFDTDIGKNNTVQHNVTDHVGWYDPRIRGGRFLDVRYFTASLNLPVIYLVFPISIQQRNEENL